MNNSEINVGILPSGEFISFANDKHGITKLIRKLKSLNPTRVLIESTGRLELDLSLIHI